MRLESALRGGGETEMPDWLSEAHELYELVQITHWTPEVIDSQPAVRLDTLRAIHHVYQRVMSGQEE